MKSSLLLPALAVLSTAAIAADPDSQPARPDVAPSVTGKATIVIDVNGKKETREIDLGKPGLAPKGAGDGVEFTKTAPAPQRTWLGVATEEPSDDVRAQLPVADGTGLLVRSVIADSPAAKAGLEQNDVLVRFDDQILANSDQLRKLVGTKKDGDVVHFTYLRKGHEATLEVKLGTHAEEITLSGGVLSFGQIIGKSVVGEIQDKLKPLVLSLNRDGKGDQIYVLHDSAKAEVESNEQWRRLFHNGLQVDVTEAMKQLDKALRDAHVDEKTILQTEKAVGEAMAGVQKAISDADAAKGSIQRELQKAVEEARRAAEQATRAAEEAARKSQSAPPAEKPQ
ncbi:PDZ domain-containing protein [Chthoniobacter flavus]|uniref:S1C family serine protease n=1 Tax=Chthoniobacter flavus TaxID=191863 RepID=UPI0010539E4E|nr:PDZ domain-containing protein [Chthoniobacter flavus]TCO93503.1 PDZ domain-containing protein [Chthoniobacter flavus]